MAKKKIVEETTPIETAVEVNEETIEEQMKIEEMFDGEESAEEMDNITEFSNDGESSEENRFIFVEDLGFSVLAYLNSEEIESIVDFVNGYTSWSDRYYAKGIATLNAATDLTDEEIKNIINNIDMIVNPFINTVYANILNWSFVEDAIVYYNSIGYKIDQLFNAIAIAGSADESNTVAEIKNIISNARKDSDE